MVPISGHPPITLDPEGPLPDAARAAPARTGGPGASARRLGKRPALDGIRGLAVLAVVFAHFELSSGLGSGGMVGVDVFFCLSGFLITTLLLEEHQATGRIRFAAFYR